MKKYILLISLILASCAPPAPQRQALATQPAVEPRLTITQDGTVKDCKGGKIASIHVTAKNVTVKNCIINNSTAFAGAIVFDSNASNGKILNNTCHDPKRACIVVHSEGNLIEGNRVTSTKANNIADDRDGFRVLASNNIVRNNYCLLTYKDQYVHADCLQGDYGSYKFFNITVEGNYFYSIDTGIQTDRNNCGNLTVTNNTIIAQRPLNIACNGVKFNDNKLSALGTGFVSIRSGSSNVEATGNLVCDTARGFNFVSGATVKGGNNIFWNSSGIAPVRDSGYSSNPPLKWNDGWQTVNKNAECASLIETGLPTLTPPTITASMTATPTRTNTPSPTATRTATLTITNTVTAIPIITPTQTPIIIECDEPCTIIVK